MEPYTTVLERSCFELEEKKSIFIGECIPVSEESEAIAFIDEVKRHYPDATHHVYAYVLRKNSTMRFSDDREPQGTAGMPTLDAIRKSGCTDVAIVTTRYFGGTLLGTGGLVRAYTASAIGALEKAKIITYDIYSEYTLQMSYSDHCKILPLLSKHSFRIEDTAFSDEVTVKGSIVSKSEEEFAYSLVQATSGRIKITKIREKFDF